MRCQLHKRTYGKHQGNSAPHRLRSVQMCLFTQEEVFLARGRSPGDDMSAVQENFEAFTRGQCGNDTSIVVGEGDLGSWRYGRDRNGGGFVWAFHHADSTIVSRGFDSSQVRGRSFDVEWGKIKASTVFLRCVSGSNGRDGWQTGSLYRHRFQWWRDEICRSWTEGVILVRPSSGKEWR